MEEGVSSRGDSKSPMTQKEASIDHGPSTLKARSSQVPKEPNTDSLDLDHVIGQSRNDIRTIREEEPSKGQSTQKDFQNQNSPQFVED